MRFISQMSSWVGARLALAASAAGDSSSQANNPADMSACFML
jgi:hypothetical protein